MSEPTHLLNNSIVTNGDMSADINSTPTEIDEAVTYSIQAVFTGAPVGNMSLQLSNDVLYPPTNWTTIDESTAAITEAGTYAVNVELPGYSYVRLIYRSTSGTGTLNARINAKRR